jgi:hypothetical protein
MKTIAFIITALLIATGVSAQDNIQKQDADNSQKIEKKEQREALQSKQLKEISALINSKRFSLEADNLNNQYGYRWFVTPNLNFILVDSSESVIQTGRNVGIGYNGVGGITAKGAIKSWKVQTNEKQKTLTVEWNVSTNIGFFNIVMYVSSSGSATATLSGNWPGRLTYEGHLIPLDDSYAYQGSSL